MMSSHMKCLGKDFKLKMTKKVTIDLCNFIDFWVFAKTANFPNATDPKLLNQFSNLKMQLADSQDPTQMVKFEPLKKPEKANSAGSQSKVAQSGGVPSPSYVK